MDGQKMLDGCSDGNCVIVKPVGMHTNGGCRCFRIPENIQKFRDELAGLKESHARLCAQVERLLPVVYEKEQLLLQNRELQEDKEALIQQRDRAHAAADSQEKDLEDSNQLNGEWIDFAGTLVQKIHDLQHTGSSPLCQQPTCKAFYEKTVTEKPKSEGNPWAPNVHQELPEKRKCQVCEGRSPEICSACMGSGLEG